MASPGDDYYTQEGGDRRIYYMVDAVPTLFVGGAYSPSSFQNVFDTEAAKPAFFQIIPSLTVNGNIADVNVEIEPFVDVSNLTVQVVIVEKMTTQNVGNNGETEFHYVMMKMLPDAGGTMQDFIAGTPVNLSFSARI